MMTHVYSTDKFINCTACQLFTIHSVEVDHHDGLHPRHLHTKSAEEEKEEVEGLVLLSWVQEVGGEAGGGNALSVTSQNTLSFLFGVFTSL